MYAKAIAVFAAASAVVSASPLDTRQSSCAAYPWFIVPFQSDNCSANPQAYQPNPGPIQFPPKNVYCQPLYQPGAPYQTFPSVAINRDPCPQQVWQINLYTDEDCKSEPVVVTSDVCVQGVNGAFSRFDAIALNQ